MSTYITFENKLDKSRETQRRINAYNQQIMNEVANKKAIITNNIVRYNQMLQYQAIAIDELKKRNSLLEQSTTTLTIPSSPVIAPLEVNPKGKSKMFLALKKHKEEEDAEAFKTLAKEPHIKKRGAFIALKKHDDEFNTH